MALPALIGGAGRALATTSRVAKAANIGSKFLGKDTKKKKPGMGTEKESSSLTIRPSTSMVPAFKPSTTSGSFSSTPKTSTSGGASLEENVAYIRKKTVEIDKLLKESFSLRKKEAKDTQKMRAALARKEKEGRFESGAKGVAANIAKKAGKPFSSIFDAIKNYITSILVGFIAIKLLPLLPKMLELLKVVGPAMDFILGIAGKLLDGLATFIDWGYKAYDATRGFIKGVGGEGAAKAFDKFSSAMNTMINLALILAMANAVGGGFGGGKSGRTRVRGGSTRPSTRPGQGTRPKVTTTGGKSAGPLSGLRETLGRANPFRQRPNITGSGGGFQFRNPFRQRPNITGSGGGFQFRNPFRQGPRITGTGAGLFGTGLFAGGFKNPFAQGPKVTGSPSGGSGILNNATKTLRSFKLPLLPKIPPGVSRALGGVSKSLGFIALVPVAFEVVDLLIKKRYKDAVRTIITAGLSAAVFQAIFGISGAAAVLKTIFSGGVATPLAIATLIGGTALATGASVGTSMGADALLRRLGLEDQPEVQLEDLSQVEAKAFGGQVGDDDEDQKRTLKQSQILPVLSTPDIGIGDVGKSVGGLKEVNKLYKPRGIEYLISLYKEVKKIPIYGEAMASAIGMALGIKPSSVSYLSMGASLINFSNLQAAENITSSTAKINQTAQKFETGGQVFAARVSLDSSIKDTTNVAQYLRNQISTIDIKSEEEKTSDRAKNLLRMMGIDFSVDEGAGEDRSSPTPPSGGGITPSGGPSTISGSNTQKWKAVYAMAQKAGAKYPELVAAQFALESAWGTALAGKNNFFGIKATSGEDATVSRTREVINGKSVYVDARFKNFNNPQDAINHLVNQWYKDYKGYRGVNNAADAHAAAMMLKSEGYATDPVYAQSLQRLLSEYSGVKGSDSDIAALTKPTQAKTTKQGGGGIFAPLTNLFGGVQEQAKNLKGTVVQWLHGNPSRAGYDAGHAGLSNAHDHFSFNSRSAAVSAFNALKKAGYAPYEFEGFTAVGKHSPTGGHFGPVGQPPTYNDKTDGTAFDIPWSSYGSGPIGQRDYDKSYRAAQIVGAAQGGGPVPGAFKELQETMGYDKSKTKVLIQPMIVEKEVPMPMPSGGGGGIMVMGGEVNNTTDSLAAG